jgi:hypothetical protein
MRGGAHRALSDARSRIVCSALYPTLWMGGMILMGVTDVDNASREVVTRPPTHCAASGNPSTSGTHPPPSLFALYWSVTVVTIQFPSSYASLPFACALLTYAAFPEISSSDSYISMSVFTLTLHWHNIQYVACVVYPAFHLCPTHAPIQTKALLSPDRWEISSFRVPTL